MSIQLFSSTTTTTTTTTTTRLNLDISDIHWIQA